MKNAVLRYFTGTGNSLRVLEVIGEQLAGKDYSIDLASITDTKASPRTDADLMGFCFPVYAYGLPRISRRYLKSLPKTARGTKAFLLVTAGDLRGSGFSLSEGRKTLARKGYDVVYTDVVEMPANWTPFIFPPDKDEAARIVAAGEEKARRIADAVASGGHYHHERDIPEGLTFRKVVWEYVTFHYLGVYQMWKMFRADDSCGSCGLCARVCPTGSITLTDGKPVWASSCEQCMRCVNFCPKQAIYQTHGGDTKGKNSYREPHFKPRNAVST